MADNLRHWKDNCNALGYDSDGEQLSLSTTAPAADGSEDLDEAAQRRAEASVFVYLCMYKKSWVGAGRSSVSPRGVQWLG